MKKAVIASLLVPLTTVGVSACGSSGNKSASGGTSGNPSQAATGSPIHIQGYGFFSGAADPYPEEQASLQAAVDAVNASGGVKGHRLVLDICNTQNNVNLAQSCAETAVSNHDVAVVTGLGDGASALPVLEKSGIAFVGNLVQAPQDATSTVSFPLSPGAYDNSTTPGVAAGQSGCKKAATIIGNYGAATQYFQNGMAAGMKSTGGAVIKNIVVSATATDFSAAVTAAKVAGANCIISALGEAGTTALLTSIHQNAPDLYLITFGSSMPSLSTIGDLGNGTYLAAAGRLPDDTNSGVALAKKQIEQYKPGTNLTETAIQAWAAVQLLKDGLDQVHGDYTAATVLAAMNSLTNASTDGVFSSYTTTHPGPIANQPRVFVNDFLVYKVVGDKVQSFGDYRPVPSA